MRGRAPKSSKTRLVGLAACRLQLHAFVAAATTVFRIVVFRIDCNPAPVRGPVVTRRSALEALYSSRVDLDAAAAVQ